jgi:hypothetical protein
MVVLATWLLEVVVRSEESKLLDSSDETVDVDKLSVLDADVVELEDWGSEVVCDAVETLELLPADALVPWELELVVVVEEIAVDDSVSMASEAVSVMIVS